MLLLRKKVSILFQNIIYYNYVVAEFTLYKNSKEM